MSSQRAASVAPAGLEPGEAGGSAREQNSDGSRVEEGGSSLEQSVDGCEQGRLSFHSLPPAVAKIGRYEVLGRIAVGGMAEIYLARETVQTGTLRHTALKLLRRKSANEADERYFEELFLREGRTASQLVHPNICHVYEFGKFQGDFFIAMEFIDGVPLRDVMARLERRCIHMSPVLAAGIVAQVAGALEYAHKARDARRRPLGVVHLDVTPQNIMLRHDGAVKLLDFGVAQVVDPEADSRSDTVKGKIGYMAPEQVLQKPLDPRVDVFCLGICLFEMLSATRLFKRENLTASLKALLKEPVPSLCAVRSDVSPELDAIVHKALALDVASRFQSAGEFQDALEGFLATSREVVSNRHIATLMEQLFPEARSQAPRLYTGPDVLARLASVVPPRTEHKESSPQTESESTLASALTASGIAARAPLTLWVALFGLLVVLGGGGWWSLREPAVVTSNNGSSQPSASGPAPVAAPAPVASPIPPVPALSLASQTQAPVAVKADGALVEAGGPAHEQNNVDAPAPAVAEPVELVEGEASKLTTPRSSRRRSSPGFVADPGF